MDEKLERRTNVEQELKNKSDKCSIKSVFLFVEAALWKKRETLRRIRQYRKITKQNR